MSYISSQNVVTEINNLGYSIPTTNGVKTIDSSTGKQVWMIVSGGTSIIKNTNYLSNTHTLGYWPLDTDWLDKSGHGLDLTDISVSGSTAPTSELALFGQNGARFQDHYADYHASYNGDLLWCENSVITSLNISTVMFWSKTLHSGGPHMAEFGIGSGNIFGVSYKNSIGASFLNITNDPITRIGCDGTKWYHYCYSTTGGYTACYLNGSLEFNVASTPQPCGWIQVGKKLETSNDIWNQVGSCIQEIIVEDRAWSAQEVSQYYTALIS